MWPLCQDCGAPFGVWLEPLEEHPLGGEDHDMVFTAGEVNDAMPLAGKASD